MNAINLYFKANKLRKNHPLIYSILRTIYEQVNNIISIRHYIFRICPVKDNKIMFSNYTGKGYGDNPKYIAEYILKNKIEYKLIWQIHPDYKMNSELPENIITVKPNSLRALYHQATARIWIDNVRKLGDTRKRKKQLYIQTWHGFGPKGCHDLKNSIVKSQIRALKHESNISDLFISNNNYLTKLYREEFWYTGEILQKGFPRNDILFITNKRDIEKKVREILNIPYNKKIILYAPTFREDLSLSTYNINYSICLKTLANKFDGEWIALIRLHHAVAENSPEINIDNVQTFDASHYLDMQELLLVSDVLITDYSSCMFDFALTKKPCFLYHPDVKDYDDTRGFCIQPEDLPFPRAHSNEELQQIIENFDEESYVMTLNKYLDSIGMCDNGTASKAVVDWIEGKINQN